ncbi:hypothetical protein HF325_004681 [Metschnikowia pulcherrima]|uniref:Uncharacterized protein n=1 Tax=Metschnikowia pulcherrima TaxID=27326 RepID=A0A8H7GQY6_9ASCO|nr:hypothetical protein HF325_004681 [Metschnikowia pulcherrima]
MRFVTIALYSLKANVLNMLVTGQRSTLLNLNYLHSLTVQEGPIATPCENEYPDICFAASNITENPII